MMTNFIIKDESIRNSNTLAIFFSIRHAIKHNREAHTIWILSIHNEVIILSSKLLEYKQEVCQRQRF